MKKLGVIVLHYKNPADTKECLASIIKNTDFGWKTYLILVLNSDEKSGKEKFSAIIKKKYPQIILVNNSSNRGFAGGNNLGIKEGLRFSCQWFLLLNNDTFLPKNFFSQLTSFVTEEKKIGLISPKIYFAKGYEFYPEKYKEEDKGKVLWYAGGVIDWKNVYVSHRGVDEVDFGQYNKVQETDFATGCALFLKKEVITKVGFLEEKYFLYFEDVDYSLKVKKAGYQVIYYPYAFLWHKNAASSGRPGSDLQSYYFVRNRFYFGFKYAPFWVKKSLFLESLKWIKEGGIKKQASFDYYLGKMGKKE